MSRKLKIMFVPLAFVGHVNSGIGLAHTLRARGHSIVYAIDRSHQELVKRYGFDVKIIDNYFWDNNGLAELESKSFLNLRLTDKKNYLWFFRQFVNFYSYLYLYIQLLYSYFNKDYKLKRIIDNEKPDILIVDDVFSYPSILYSGRPWVWLFSANPLGFYRDETLPSPFMGYGSKEKGWGAYLGHVLLKEVEKHMLRFYKIAFLLRGYPPNPDNHTVPCSPYLNIYGYPKELDYNYGPLKFPNTFRIDMFVPPMIDNTELSADLKAFLSDSKDKKLIYVSLGSFIPADVKYMKKLVHILAQSEHRYIIAKGMNHQLYDLPDNMWGEKYVPQKQIIPLVDLVITNGGNNSVVETFTYGKPQIVIPFWLDGFDNAKRIDELGYGVQLNGQHLDNNVLLGAIERLLSDQPLKQRLAIASKRMLSSDTLDIAANLIENLQSF